MVCPAMAHHIPVPRCATVCHGVPPWHKLTRSDSQRIAADRSGSLSWNEDRKFGNDWIEKVQKTLFLRIAAIRYGKKTHFLQDTRLTTTPQRHHKDSGKSDRVFAKSRNFA